MNPDVLIIINQISVIVAVAFVFGFGVWASYLIGDDSRPSSLKEIVAYSTIGFGLFGTCLCGTVYHTLVATNSDLMSVLPIIGPVLAGGYTTRRELDRLFKQKAQEST